MTREEQIRQAAKGTWDEPSFISGAKWADESPKNPWISVNERLPEDYQWVVGCVYNSEDKSLIMLDYRLPNNKWGLHNENKYTHWMPVPELPKED